MGGLKPCKSLELVGLGVLDKVPLVENNKLVLGLLKDADCLLHNSIAGDDQVVFELILAEGDEVGIIFSEYAAGIQASIGKVFLVLVSPVLYQGGRNNDQTHLALLIRLGVLVLNHSQSLQGFAEPHVVAEGSIQIVFYEETQPFYPLLLVVSEFKLLLYFQFVLKVVDVFEIPHE